MSGKKNQRQKIRTFTASSSFLSLFRFFILPVEDMVVAGKMESSDCILCGKCVD